MEEFLKEAGAERVTEDAVVDLEKELVKLTESLANKAIRYAAHAGRRKLINKNDVLLTRSDVITGRVRPAAYARPRMLVRRRPGAVRTAQVRV